MILKVGRNEFDINTKDVIFFNGACYMLLTRKVFGGYHYYNPTVSKSRMKKLIKDGVFIEFTPSNPPYIRDNYKYYKLAGDLDEKATS